MIGINTSGTSSWNKLLKFISCSMFLCLNQQILDFPKYSTWYYIHVLPKKKKKKKNIFKVSLSLISYSSVSVSYKSFHKANICLHVLSAWSGPYNISSSLDFVNNKLKYKFDIVINWVSILVSKCMSQLIEQLANTSPTKSWEGLPFVLYI